MKLKKYLYKKVESTNNVALRLIKQGNQRGIILTDQQTKGKGQRKNKWISIKGNLFLSVFFEISKKISLSKMTFSHQMVRLFFLEQLFRGYSILNNQPYHHE